MARLLFLPNSYLLDWITWAGPPAVIARQVNAGFRLPEFGTEFLPGGEETRLKALETEALVLVFPALPPRQFVRAPFVPLTETQRRLLYLRSQKLTTGQIAALMGHSQRWVRYQFRRIRAVAGLDPKPGILNRDKG